jgi:hypothetical protein
MFLNHGLIASETQDNAAPSGNKERRTMKLGDLIARQAFQRRGLIHWKQRLNWEDHFREMRRDGLPSPPE